MVILTRALNEISLLTIKLLWISLRVMATRVHAWIIKRMMFVSDFLTGNIADMTTLQFDNKMFDWGSWRSTNVMSHGFIERMIYGQCMHVHGKDAREQLGCWWLTSLLAGRPVTTRRTPQMKVACWIITIVTFMVNSGDEKAGNWGTLTALCFLMKPVKSESYLGLHVYAVTR